jgi:hypothetical protein
MKGGLDQNQMSAMVHSWVEKEHTPTEDELALVLPVEEFYPKSVGEEIPLWVFRLVHLKSFHLGESWRLKSIPAEIRNLTQLKEFTCSFGVRVTELPDAIGELALLEKLVLSNTYVSSLPPSVSNLKNLKKVDMEGTLIAEFPPPLAELQSLEVLSFSLCEKLSLKEGDFGGLVNLKNLYLGGSSVQMVPEGLRACKSLEWLDLECCANIAEVPAWLAELNLKCLKLSNTGLTAVPRELLTKFPVKNIRLSSAWHKSECLSPVDNGPLE